MEAFFIVYLHPLERPVCPEGYVINEELEACYHLEQVQPCPVSAAQRICQREGGNLASIDSALEEQFLTCKKARAFKT